MSTPPSSLNVVWNIPNTITLARFALSCVLFALIAIGGESAAVPAAALFVFSASTDWVDGFLARRWNQVTTFGRVVDPLVDKVIVCGTFIFLLERSATSGVSAVMVLIIIGRELLVTGLRTFLEQQGRDFSAAWIGKVKMTLQSVAVTVSLLSLSTSWRELPGFVMWRDVLLWATVAITAYSGVLYVARAFMPNRTASVK